ncbi:hypothetical protein BJY52DRAFT_1223446 [Lactarius psammicola]|nr:hypothetical protein BJY52DRAFT_1223446 [Lactarius psammicola]
MPLNTEEDTPQPCTTRSKKSGNKQKGKNANQQVKPASATCSTPGNGSEGVIEDENEVMARIAKAKEELKMLEAQKEAIAKEISDSSAMTASVPKIGRPPRGTSIQAGMGLLNNKPKYDAIRRLVRDLIGEAGINWELPWSEVSAIKKAKLYQTAREEAPFLKKFVNDWPTQMLAMQLMKNKRGHSYHCGYLEVPSKYSYLKANAAKRKQNGHSARVTPQLGGGEEEMNDSEPTDMPAATLGSTLKRAALATAAAQQPRKKKQKTTPGAANTRSKSKAKQRAIASPIEAEVEDDDDEEDVDETLDSNEVDVVDLEE